MTTDTLIKVNTESISRIDEIVGECGLIQSAQEQGVMAAFRMAAGVGALKRLITDEMMSSIMELQGTPLGFKTDKDSSGGYQLPVVKDCLIEALLRGARPIGNEFNIISGRAYLTKEYFTRQLAELPGLNNLVIEFGVPSIAGDKGALVPVKATWVYRGRRDSLVCDLERDESGKIVSDSRIPIRVNNGMGTDAILGKADRKIRARVMSRITNTTWSDADVSDVIETTAEPVAANGSLKDRLKSSTHQRTSTPEVNGMPAADIGEDGAKEPNSGPPSPPREQSRSFSPLPGEDPKGYHQRLVKEIELALDEETLGAIQAAVNEAEQSKSLTPLRANDLNKKIDARFDKIAAS